ncbi:sensor histidine kinase [Pontiella sulfatireligans]|uniref:Histidine kinase/HSP90-like ATPase domain-containing protein n=1 Tax=Pontiella sulfatireligans TaxID=2750658 RepID=A0A6C2UV68_9BACT|nr:sensor histidine kinase [Pontiella sulfatireligans]VGO23007.1 hypothetical protein SCARR_05106 [Pontiella sulfatireligans]
MRRQKLVVYMVAWLIHAGLIFFLFPELKITAMLLSMPMGMLAAWLYAYKGAIITLMLNILFHYYMLQYYSNDPGVIREAFNPFGNGTELCFSLCTALLKKTQLRYQHLNSTLELMVEERTRKLSQLADHLIKDKTMEAALAVERIIEEPKRQLSNMMADSSLLVRQLRKAQHPDGDTAKTITEQIRLCLERLKVLELGLPINSRASTKPDESIHQIAQQYETLAAGCTKMVVSGNWTELHSATSGQLYPIVHEAVTNALRHASPSRIIIGLQSNPGALVVYVENDGKPMPAAHREGMGIPLMRYRAQRMGASLSIHAGEKQNTRVQCVIPRNDH